MKLSLSVESRADDQLIFAQQLGVEEVFIEIEDWGAAALASLSNRVDKAGLRLAGCILQPTNRHTGPDLAGYPYAVDDLYQLIEHAAQAGIPRISLGWSHIRAREAERVPEGRGESSIAPQNQEMRLSDSSDPLVAQTAWGELSNVVEKLISISESTGVRLAWQSDELPSVDTGDPSPSRGLVRLLELSSSSHHGIDLSLASFGNTADALEAIRQTGDRIFSVLLLNHTGSSPLSRQAFLDEGTLDIPAVLRTLKEVGFSGPIRAARGPGMVEDTEWGHKGRAFDLGYVRAILQQLDVN